MQEQGALMLNLKAEADAIFRWVCEAYGIEPSDLTGNSRMEPIAEARNVAYYLARQRGMSYPRIGRLFKRDHTSVISGVKRVQALLKADVGVGALVVKYCAERRAFDEECMRIVAAKPPDKAVDNYVQSTGLDTGLATALPSPLASPLPATNHKLSESLAESGSASLLSSGSGSESKRARGRPKSERWRRVPESWQPADAHRQLASELHVNLDLELGKFRDHEFRDPKSDADAAFRRWIRTAAEYGSRPQRINGIPTGLEEHNAHKQARGAKIMQAVFLKQQGAKP